MASIIGIQQFIVDTCDEDVFVELVNCYLEKELK